MLRTGRRQGAAGRARHCRWIWCRFTAHKLYGPKGIGALYVRARGTAPLQPLIFGGGQEAGLRPGTLATHQIAGFGVACELAARELRAGGRAAHGAARAAVARACTAGRRALNGAAAPRVPGILNVSFEGVEGESLVTGLRGAGGLDRRGVQLGLRGALLRAAGPRARRTAGGRARCASASGAIPATPTSTSPPPPCVARSSGCAELSPAAGSRRGAGAMARIGAAAAGEAVVTGEAGGPQQEAWVRFHLLVARRHCEERTFPGPGLPPYSGCGRLADALSCPAGARAALVPGTPGEWARALRRAGGEARPPAGDRRRLARLSWTWPRTGRGRRSARMRRAWQFH